MAILFARRMKSKSDPVPGTPTNEERLKDFRQRATTILGNGWRWAWHSWHRKN